GVDGGIGVFQLRALAAGQRHDVLTLAGLVLGFRAARIGIEGRPLVAGAAAEHVAQLHEDHDCRDQEEDRAEIENFHCSAKSLSSDGCVAGVSLAYRTHPPIIQIKASAPYLEWKPSHAPPLAQTRNPPSCRFFPSPSSPCRSSRSPASPSSAA